MERSDTSLRAVASRLEELVAEYGLPAAAAKPLQSILTSLSGEHAPTAVKDPKQGVNVHIADSLSALDAVKAGDHGRIADIGSGCGVPALILAVALPDAEFVAVESQRRKCEFIAEAAVQARLSNVSTAWSRAEEWTDGHAGCDIVTARALADLPVVMEYSAPLLRDGGRLIAWKGRLEDGELERGARAAATLRMSTPETIEVEPWPTGGLRRLVVSSKTGDLPEGFPRRAGMATKRPLGS